MALCLSLCAAACENNCLTVPLYILHGTSYVNHKHRDVLPLLVLFQPWKPHHDRLQLFSYHRPPPRVYLFSSRCFFRPWLPLMGGRKAVWHRGRFCSTRRPIMPYFAAISPLHPLSLLSLAPPRARITQQQYRTVACPRPLCQFRCRSVFPTEPRGQSLSDLLEEHAQQLKTRRADEHVSAPLHHVHVWT